MGLTLPPAPWYAHDDRIEFDDNGEKLIHPKYTEWIKNLELDIRHNLAARNP